MHACMQIQTTQWRAVSIRLRRAPALPVPPSTSGTNHRHYLAGGVDARSGMWCPHGPAGEPTGDRSLETRADAMPPHRGHGRHIDDGERERAGHADRAFPPWQQFNKRLIRGLKKKLGLRTSEAQAMRGCCLPVLEPNVNITLLLWHPIRNWGELGKDSASKCSNLLPSVLWCFNVWACEKLQLLWCLLVLDCWYTPVCYRHSNAY
jgi:hypothetical protein